MYEGKQMVATYGNYSKWLRAMNEQAKKKPFREKYWLPILIVTGLVTYIAGIFSPVFTEMAKKAILEPDIQDTTKTRIDMVETLRIDTVRDTVYLPDSLLKK